MTGQAPLGVGLQPPGSLELERPVWGIDPSTQRISVACVRGGLEWVETLSLPRLDKFRRWGGAYEALEPWLRALVAKDAHRLGCPPRPERLAIPSHVYVEEPFAPTERRQVPTSYYAMGVLWAALSAALPGHVKFEEIGPGTWKRTAMGEGHGAAKPWQYFEWARDIAGYAGSIEDEAAAIGVATAAGVIVSGGAGA